MQGPTQYFVSYVVREMSMSTNTKVSYPRVRSMKSSGYRWLVVQKRHALVEILLSYSYGISSNTWYADRDE
jgi:hypothetical protein